MLYEQLKGSAALKEVIGRYDRARPSCSKRTYKFLKVQIEKHLARDKKVKTRENIARALNGGLTPTVVAAPATTDGKGTSKKAKARKAKDAVAAAAAAERSKSPGGPFLGADGKQKPCAKFASGTCEYGDKCRFANGKAAKSKAKAKGEAKKPGTPPLRGSRQRRRLQRPAHFIHRKRVA